MKPELNLNQVLHRVIKSDQDREAVTRFSTGEFVSALITLRDAGLTPDQAQWFVGSPLSRMSDYKRCGIVAMARGIQLDHLSVAEIHDALLEEEARCHLYGSTVKFKTDPIPDLSALARDLGMGHHQASPTPLPALNSGPTDRNSVTHGENK